MRLKINHLLIPVCWFCLLFLLSSPPPATGSSPNLSYLPVINSGLRGWIGPYGGFIVAMAIDPTDPQVLYAGTRGSGIYKSLDGGLSWHAANTGLGSLSINSLAIDPQTHTTLYAGMYKNQIYKSTDGGASWKLSASGMQAEAVVYSIAIDPSQPSRIYAATRGISNNGNPPWSGILYRSMDSGQSWLPVLQNVGGADAQDWAYSLAIDPAHTWSVYAATHEHGPYHSNDYGNSWYPSHDGIYDDSGRSIAINPDTSNGTILYYGVWHYDTVYKSINGGNDWFLSNNGNYYVKVYEIAIDPLHGDTVYLATFNRGVLKTEDGGTFWSSGGLDSSLIYTLSINPTTPTQLYAGTAGEGVFSSPDAGDNWVPANTGIENSMPTAVLAPPSDPYTLYASIYGAGVLRSQDGGQTWTQINSGLTDKYVHTLVYDPAHPWLLYALTDGAGLFRYDLSNGGSWTAVGGGLPLTCTPHPGFPTGHPFASDDLQEAVQTPASSPDSPLASVNLYSISYAPSNQQVAYMGTGGSGVYKSTNGGDYWNPAGLAGENVTNLAVSPADANLVYAATASAGSLRVSSDGGGTWSSLSLPVTFYAVTTSPAAPAAVYTGTSAGVYRYASGTWKLLGLGSQSITALWVDAANPAKLIAGTTAGAFYTNDGGLTWKTVNPLLDNYPIQAINLDPTQPNHFYFSTSTHGIFTASPGN